jgi:hypothetical protein
MAPEVLRQPAKEVFASLDKDSNAEATLMLILISIQHINHLLSHKIDVSCVPSSAYDQSSADS